MFETIRNEIIATYKLDSLTGQALLSAADAALDAIEEYFTHSDDEYWWLTEVIEEYRATAKAQMRRPVIESMPRTLPNVNDVNCPPASKEYLTFSW
jgi:hypothetical protein